jgi:phosphoglycolate phosphatase-like HAD superfamily hydrolase
MGKLAELLKDEGQTEQTYTLYCDMDGVLCDFDSRFLEVLRETGKKHYSIKGITSANDFEDKYGKEEFWKFIDCRSTLLGRNGMDTIGSKALELYKEIQSNPTNLSIQRQQLPLRKKIMGKESHPRYTSCI